MPVNEIVVLLTGIVGVMGAIIGAAKIIANAPAERRKTEAEADQADAEAAKAWLQREIRSLGGVTPLSLLDTDPGVDMVMDTLGRIEQGIAA